MKSLSLLSGTTVALEFRENDLTVDVNRLQAEYRVRVGYLSVSRTSNPLIPTALHS